MGFAQVLNDQAGSKSFIPVNQIIGDKHSAVGLVSLDDSYNAIQVSGDLTDELTAGGHVELTCEYSRFNQVYQVAGAVPDGIHTNLLILKGFLPLEESLSITGQITVRQIWLGLTVGYDKGRKEFVKFDLQDPDQEFVGLVTKIVNVNRFEISLPGEYIDSISGFDLDSDSTYYADPQNHGKLIKDSSNLKVLVTKGDSGLIKGFVQLNDINSKLDLLIPAQPVSLNQKTVTITGLYTARETVTGELKNNVTSDPTPEIILSPFEDANGFKEEVGQELEGIVNQVVIGKKLLTGQSDSGDYDGAGNPAVSGDRLHLEDFDFYAGQAGKAGFWIAVKIKIIVASELTGILNTASLRMENQETQVFSFNIDDPQLPVISSREVHSVVLAADQKKVSGVPVLSSGDKIRISAVVNNAINRFYRNGNILEAASGQTSSNGAGKTGRGIEGEAFEVSEANGNLVELTVLASRFSADWQGSLTAYNSRNQTAAGVVKKTGRIIRIDSLSNEVNRLEAGSGQFPVSGYGGAYDGSVDLSTAGNQALMMENGKYRYPSGNFSTLYPAIGPDYSGLPGLELSGAHYRWVLFNLGQITDQSFITFTITGAENFTQKIEADVKLYAKVEGATGWLDAGAAYSAGNPAADGDPALDYGASSAIFKRVTFGAAVRSGILWVRIGLSSTSNKKFTSIS